MIYKPENKKKKKIKQNARKHGKGQSFVNCSTTL